MTKVEVFAPAKINLTLHVTGQRPDGYHLIDSLVMFAGLGDHLTLEDADTPSFAVSGPFAGSVPQGDDNLVVKALALAGYPHPVAVHLRKDLPPSSGIGGGSADAAAAFRGILQLAGYAGERETMPFTDGLLRIGADVPMCLASRSARVRGIGEKLEPVPGLPALPVVLANPLRALSTPDVFAALQSKANAPMPDTLPRFADAEAFTSWLEAQRNDLEPAAISCLPVIADVLAALSASSGARLARMSGSGATCVGTFGDEGSARAAAEKLDRDHPDWWVRHAVLGGQGERAQPIVAGRD